MYMHIYLTCMYYICILYICIEESISVILHSIQYNNDNDNSNTDYHKSNL